MSQATFKRRLEYQQGRGQQEVVPHHVRGADEGRPDRERRDHEQWPTCACWSTLAATVPLNRARGNSLAKFVVALLRVKTVNLAEAASVFAGRALPASSYKRIQRFLRSFELRRGRAGALAPLGRAGALRAHP